MGIREQLEKFVDDSGLWAGGGTNYRFLLSPDVYFLKATQAEALEGLGRSLFNVLGGLGRIRATASIPNLAFGVTWGMIEKALRVGIPEFYHELGGIKPSCVPSVCKVDLMQGIDGGFHIAEIDGHNKHGMGYSTLAAGLRDICAPGAGTFPGVATRIARVVKELNAERANLFLLYADQERFYLPEFVILAKELIKHGVAVKISAESELGRDKAQLQKLVKEWPLFVDLPFLYHNDVLRDLLKEELEAGGVNFLIPPKPFLGSKAVLAILRNDERDLQLEGILHSQIPAGDLERVRLCIPETYLIHNRKKKGYWMERCQGKRFVLKEAVSSGMKGVIFADDPGFDAIFEQACKARYRFVLQEEVVNLPKHYRYFGDDGREDEDDWYTRVTVHYTQLNVADVVVTARQDKRVHGAPDCLQLGTVIR